MQASGQEIVPRNGPDFRLIPVTVEHLFAKREKGGVRQAIVFEDDPFFLLIEKPANRFADRGATSQVLVPEKCFNFAIPIDSLQNGPGFSAESPFAAFLGSRPIGSHIKARRLVRADRLKDLLRRFWTIEDKE